MLHGGRDPIPADCADRWGLLGLPHVREKCFFSRSGKCQGILKFAREKMKFRKCHGKLTCVREKLNFQVHTQRIC